MQEKTKIRTCFFAPEEIQPGEHWRKKRDKALNECDTLIFIVTSTVTTSPEVHYEIRRAKELDKNIIPCKHIDIDDWSQIEKEFRLDSIQYLPFDDKDDLLNKIHRLFAVILQQSPKQNVAEEQTGLRLRVKSYQCVFRSKPPNSGGSGDTVSADKLEVIDRIVREVDRPYWVYTMILIDKLDIRYLESQIEEKSGQENTGSSENFVKDIRTGQNISMGQRVEFPFGNLKDDAIIKAQLSSGENADSVIQIWFISGGDDVGFYKAHTLLSPDKILSILLSDIARSEVQRIIKDACSKPSSLESNLTDQ